jgi:hypothetical protein
MHSPIEPSRKRHQRYQKLARSLARGNQKRLNDASIEPQAIDHRVIRYGAGVHPLDFSRVMKPPDVLNFKQQAGRVSSEALVVADLEGERAALSE